MKNHKESGYYWVRVRKGSRWHIAYHNQYGWTYSYPDEEYRTNDKIIFEFEDIVGPIKTPCDNQKEKRGC